MHRALQLAANGRGTTSPNPMVGAVIVCDGRIIGEGWHRVFGGPHAEVNAVSSVADRELLRRSTMYVTLEPCSHYGKTPPCAELILKCGIPRVVVGSLDPNEKVSGRGVAMLRNAGVEVVVGVLEEQCKELNVKFMTAHSRRRPYVLLKWAMSADCFLDSVRAPGEPAPRFSTPLTSQAMHRLRSDYDAILVGADTVINDDPRLDVRDWPGRSPLKVVLDRRGRVPACSKLFASGKTLYFSSVMRSDIPSAEIVLCDPSAGPEFVLSQLFSRGIVSVMVEGGAAVLGSFLASGLWDEARVEIGHKALGDSGRVAMTLPSGTVSSAKLDGNIIINVKNAVV